jgi:hypothetical protein
VCFDPTAVTDGTRARRRSGAAPGAVIESCGEFESEVEFVDGDEGSESFACWSSGEGGGLEFFRGETSFDVEESDRVGVAEDG